MKQPTLLDKLSSDKAIIWHSIIAIWHMKGFTLNKDSSETNYI
jgi:hypothetical protein